MAIKVSAARKAAFEVLRKIEAEAAFSAILLPAFEENLKIEDRALCHALVLGVLRNQIFLDRLIEHFSGKKIGKLDLAVKIALRLALFQLRYLQKIPPSAAVNESVNLIYLAKKRSAAGFVNAVLRRSEREKSFDLLGNIEDPLEKLSVETSHPIWLLEKWRRQFGLPETAEIARTNNRPPPTAFRVTNQSDQIILTELENAGGELEKSKIAASARRVSGANQIVRKLMSENRIYLQDEASQLVAEIVCNSQSAVSDQKEFRFLDACAAPGSKTTQISSRFQVSNSVFQASNSGFLHVAGDFSLPRVRILKETIEKFGSRSIEIVRYDARRLPFADESFASILIDAPCSGTGTIRHNPEIRFNLRETDFPALTILQAGILRSAARVVRKNGRIVYSTCSLEPEENEAIIDDFLSKNSNFTISTKELPEKFVTEKGFARTFPPRDDADGFFVAVLHRIH